MDFTYGGGAGPMPMGMSPRRGRNFFSRLTGKAKILLGCVILFVFYRVFLRSSGDDGDVTPAGSAGDSIHSDVEDLVDSKQISTISLSYLDLTPPFIDSNSLRFYNYINGGNMQLEKNAPYVRLVPDRTSSMGYLFSRNSISDSDSSAIEMEIEFKIHGAQKKTALIGDGMAIWITDSQLKRGSVFGMQSDYTGLGIFLDTYRNADNRVYRHTSSRRFPYLSLQPNYGDPNKYNKAEDGFKTELDGCTLHNIYNIGRDVTVSKMRILYLRQSNYFQIDVDARGDGDWRTCVQRRDFPAELIPAKPYVGISAETGQLSQAVDIYSMKIRTFRTKNGGLVGDVDKLMAELGMAGEVLVDEPQHDTTGKTHPPRKHRRRALDRLKRQERVLKQREQEKWGNQNGFIGWLGNLVWKIIKGILYSLLTAILGYFCFIGYRVYRDKRRSRQRQGLL